MMQIRRLIALLLILTFALATANLLYAALATRQTLLQGSPGDLLYSAAFDGFTDEWDTYRGQQSAHIHEGRLELAISAAQTAAWSSARPHFADFDISVQATAIAGPDDNGFGIIFRQQSPPAGVCDLPALILCAIEEYLPLAGAALRQIIEPQGIASYYAFLISSDGYYSVWKTAKGVQRKLSAWIPSAHIKQGLHAQNAIRVIARGAAFQFFINGEPVMLCIPDDPQAASTYANDACIQGTMQAALHDDSLPVGQLGIIARTTPGGGPGVAVQFDNLLVFSPADGTSDEDRA